jgi:hypothetical protein
MNVSREGISERNRNYLKDFSFATRETVLYRRVGALVSFEHQGIPSCKFAALALDSRLRPHRF